MQSASSDDNVQKRFLEKHFELGLVYSDWKDVTCCTLHDYMQYDRLSLQQLSLLLFKLCMHILALSGRITVIKPLLLRCVILALDVSVNSSGAISTLNDGGFSSLIMTSTSNKKKGKGQRVLVVLSSFLYVLQCG